MVGGQHARAVPAAPIFRPVRRPILRPLGRAWKEVREEVNATQADVAEVLGLSGGQSAVSQRETGKTALFNPEELVSFEDHYGLQRGTVFRRAGYVVDADTPDEIIGSWDFLSPDVREMLRRVVMPSWEERAQHTPQPRRGRGQA